MDTPGRGEGDDQNEIRKEKNKSARKTVEGARGGNNIIGPGIWTSTLRFSLVALVYLLRGSPCQRVRRRSRP